MTPTYMFIMYGALIYAKGSFSCDLFEEICLILTKREFRMGECSILKGRTVAGEGNAPLSMTNKILICYAVIQ